MNYYILVNGQQTGPFSIEQLGVTGIEPDTMVWTEGMSEWQPAWQVAALATIMKPGNTAAAPPPQPAAPQQPQYNNTVAPADNTAATIGNDPYAPLQPKKKKKTWLWILLAFIVLLAAAAITLKLTNPDKKAHMEKLESVMKEAMGKMDTSGMDDATKMGMQLGMGMISKMGDNAFEYHDKFFYSYMTAKGSDEKLTTGFLGSVKIVNEEEIAKLFESMNKLNDLGNDDKEDTATDELDSDEEDSFTDDFSIEESNESESDEGRVF